MLDEEKKSNSERAEVTSLGMPVDPKPETNGLDFSGPTKIGKNKSAINPEKASESYTIGNSPTKQEKATQTRIFNKAQKELGGPATAGQEQKKEEYKIVDPVENKKTNAEWAKRAGDIATQTENDIADFNQLEGSALRNAKHQIDRSTRKQIEQEKADETNRYNYYKDVTPTEKQASPDYGYSYLDDKEKSTLSEASKTINELEAKEGKGKPLSDKDKAKLDEAKKVSSELMDKEKTSGEEFIKNQNEQIEAEKNKLQEARNIVNNPSEYSDDDIEEAKDLLKKDEDFSFKLSLIEKNPKITKEEIQEELDYKHASEDYVEGLKILQNDPDTREWATNELDMFNYRKALMEKYPGLVNKKTAQQILEKSISDHARVNQLKQQGMKREAEAELKRQKEREAKIMRIITIAAGAFGGIAVRLFPLLYLGQYRR